MGNGFLQVFGLGFPLLINYTSVRETYLKRIFDFHIGGKEGFLLLPLPHKHKFYSFNHKFQFFIVVG